ncbi:hypothetical protein CUC00_03615 [Prevotella intermedia]|uniref:Uncharacterized protein n=2 Tax=Prevotella intermedia TaxID=28131 RepID=A0AAP0V710_PREIN|nr:hypothetical protein [Prevotella intermedia]AFJ09619.1 hypothetical protein PIN17_A1032 [Prevotella intermedia 17]APW34004.1 hypothetical protein BWX40_03675 [Prevotella intermedia]ATV33375.1 hypothetical protein CTM44_06330 [Prevotella intermedia]ATV40220.1 hypothetical protein CUC00_03615 [Prevotella intermedia]KJJ87487.1 hypothetical protein M573_106078 [Prevotella intermedia ZT]
MAQQKAVRSFILEAIKGLKSDEFNELVCIFQTSYLHNNEAINVDGANDGGCDIKVFQNKREIKKCVQVTIQKKIDLKLKKDLEKVSKMISQYGYSNKFEFYCSIPISEDKIEKYKKLAIDEHDIELDIYEAKRLSELDCKEVADYIYSLHTGMVLKPEQMNIDKATRTLYDLLANGKDSSDIKNSLVDSVIISILYEKAPIDSLGLKKELENRLGKNIPDILHSVNSLKTDQRIIKFPDDHNLIQLSDLEYGNVKEILAHSRKAEKDFCDSFAEILAKFQIDYNEEVLNKLKLLYKNNYSNDIDNNTQSDESSDLAIFESFKKYLLNIIDDKENIDKLIQEISSLCSSNNYLNKISASESFLSLYKSNQLEQYLSQKHKDIYLDTPTFVYLLCSYYGVDNNDWDNPFYRSMKSLIKLKDNYPDKISFYITQNYLGEVAGEIKKALVFSQFESYPCFKDMGGTRNTLFNYYEYLKHSELFDKDDNIENFKDFIYSLGLDNTNPNDARFFKDANQFLSQVAEDYDISMISWSQNDKYAEFKVAYEKMLLANSKNKSEMAICNDVNQVIVSLEHDRDTDCYLITWDTTIHLLRDKVLSEDEHLKYSYFFICNPAKLSNRIALENFNIDGSALTNDIFAYADKRYDISNRVKSLLELIAPFLKGDGSKKIFRKLGRIRKEQIELRGSEVGNEKEEKSLPIEEIFMLLIPNKDKEKEDKNIMEKFSVFMSSEENSDYIINIIDQISELKDYKMYDFTEYFGKIKSIDLSGLNEE